jgi:hypothetical protein
MDKEVIIAPEKALSSHSNPIQIPMLINLVVGPESLRNPW